jgi:hypothetical protein
LLACLQAELVAASRQLAAAETAIKRCHAEAGPDIDAHDGGSLRRAVRDKVQALDQLATAEKRLLESADSGAVLVDEDADGAFEATGPAQSRTASVEPRRQLALSPLSLPSEATSKAPDKAVATAGRRSEDGETPAASLASYFSAKLGRVVGLLSGDGSPPPTAAAPQPARLTGQQPESLASWLDRTSALFEDVDRLLSQDLPGSASSAGPMPRTAAADSNGGYGVAAGWNASWGATDMDNNDDNDDINDNDDAVSVGPDGGARLDEALRDGGVDVAWVLSSLEGGAAGESAKSAALEAARAARKAHSAQEAAAAAAREASAAAAVRRARRAELAALVSVDGYITNCLTSHKILNSSWNIISTICLHFFFPFPEQVQDSRRGVGAAQQGLLAAMHSKDEAGAAGIDKQVMRAAAASAAEALERAESALVAARERLAVAEVEARTAALARAAAVDELRSRQRALEGCMDAALALLPVGGEPAAAETPANRPGSAELAAVLLEERWFSPATSVSVSDA